MKKAEQQLKEARSIEKHSLSSINSVDRKIKSEREEISDISVVISQKTFQLESIERLVTAAQKRLNREKETLEQVKQEIEFSENSEEKQTAETRLKSL